MRFVQLSLCLLTLAALGTGCRSLSVRGAEPGQLELLRPPPSEDVYLEPFDHSEAQLEGAHGGDGNKDKWFSHVVFGAQGAAAKAGLRVHLVGDRPAQLAEIERKANGNISSVPSTPDDAITVRGRYVYSKEVSGTGRALIGMGAGKSWTRARVEILRGDGLVYTCHIDGKYLGSTYSWGYETLGANEELGRAIVEVIAALRDGKPVESEPLTPP